MTADPRLNEAVRPGDEPPWRGLDGETKEALTLGTMALQGFQPVSIGLTWKLATEVNPIVTVTAVYERDVQGRWLVHIAEEPRCHTWARSYASARREIIDAGERWLDELGVESLDNLDIRDEVRIAGAVRPAAALPSSSPRCNARRRRCWPRSSPARTRR